MKKAANFLLIAMVAASSLGLNADNGADIWGPTLGGAAIGGLAGGRKGAGIGAAVGLGAGLIGHAARDSDRRYRGSEPGCRREIRSLEKENNRLYNRVEEIEDDNAALQAEVDELTTQVKDLKNENRTLSKFEKENEKLSNKIEALEKDNAALQEEINNLNNQVKEAEKENKKIERLERTIEKKDKEIQKLQAA